MAEVKAETKSKRDQVLEMLREGGYTREEIADALDMTVASVSSQFTYLRWMGNFIIYDEDKVIHLVNQEEYDKWLEEKAANRKTKSSTSAKTPQEQADALDKTIKNQTKQLENWQAKKTKIDNDLEAMPDDDELQEMQAEAAANITLLQIKIKRNNAKLADLPEPADADDIEAEVADDVEADDDDLV